MSECVPCVASESQIWRFFMKGRAFELAVRVIPILVLASTAVLAQSGTPKTFSEMIDGYSPQTPTTNGPTTTTTGPYEVRGPWSLKLKWDSRKADFSAALNMRSEEH